MLDIGFMMYCSFGNAYRLTQNEKIQGYTYTIRILFGYTL